MAELKRERAVIWCAVSSEAQAADGKESLSGQEADCRDYCTRAGLEVIEVLRVPGYSRFYDNLDDCAADMAAQGIYAFNQLRQLWEDQAFDVLIARDAERLSRTLAMLAQIIGRVIKSGARIYLLQGGEINKHNRLWAGVMGGFKAESHIDFLVTERDRAMNARANAGLPTSSVVVISHNLLREPRTGAALKLVLDETKRPLWNDLAALILKGTAWNVIEKQLYHRGHAHPSGGPWQPGRFYTLVHIPTFWGNSARHTRANLKIGECIFEPGHEIPAGVTIHYGTHDPVWNPADPLTAQIRAELRRRMNIRGHASPEHTYRFSGIFLCAECGYYLSLQKNSRFVGVHCTSKYHVSPTRPNCTQGKYLSDKRAWEWIDARLREAVRHQDPDQLLGTQTAPNEDADTRKNIAAQIRDTETLLGRLVIERAGAEEILQHVYDKQISAMTTRLKALQQEAFRLDHAAARQAVATNRTRALQEIAQLTVDQFWEQDDRYVNQTLLRPLGNRRLVVKDKQIIGSASAPIRRKRKR